MASSELLEDKIGIFLTSISDLSSGEIVKAKELFIRNQIVDFNTAAEMFKIQWWYFIPPFIIFLLTRNFQKSALKGEKQKLLNTLEMWKLELHDCYHELKEDINQIQF